MRFSLVLELAFEHVFEKNNQAYEYLTGYDKFFFKIFLKKLEAIENWKIGKK